MAKLHTRHHCLDILITDISLGGVKLQLRKGIGSLPVEKQVILDIPLFNEIHAVIAWNDDCIHGIKFLECPPALIRFIDSISTQTARNEGLA